MVRLLAGAWFIASFALAAFGQDAPTFPAPPVTIGEASALTNAPTAATATVVPEPALPEVTIPKPGQVDIPSATAIPTGPVLPVSHPQPVMPPTAQDLLSKTMQSGPAGSQSKLAAIEAVPAPGAVTNAAPPATAISWVTNSPDNQSDIWRTNSPVMDGVHYHW
jgi:hypothetical protein